jgi:hypothetical protein
MKTNSKSPMDRVRKPQGRPDWLFAKVLEKAVSQSQDETVKTAYLVVRNDLERLLMTSLGPRTKRGKQVRALLEKAKQVLREVQAA